MLPEEQTDDQPEYLDDEVVELTDEEIEEQREQTRAQEEEKAARLDKLGISLSRTRSEAIAGRADSGIEKEWLEDEEYYEGIDDANRGEMSAWRSKPLGKVGIAGDDTGSTVFINITQQYVDGVAARMGDMLLPTDDSAFKVERTPVPELASLVTQGKVPRKVQDQINAAYPNRPDLAQSETQRLIAEAQKKDQEATEKAAKAQTRIEDWHVECQYHAQVRSVIEDCSRLGSGVLKGPVPQKRRQIAYIDGALVIKEEIVPGSLRIDPWNLYPDPGCGQNIHNGSYIWECDDITVKQLQELKGTPGYIDNQIDKVIEEGPQKAIRIEQNKPESNSGMMPRNTAGLFQIWYGHCQIEREDMEAAGAKVPDGPIPQIHAQVTMVNNTVIRVTMNPLDTGEFPYDVMVMKRRSGMPWGTGISRQIRTPQRIVNGAARNLMDNAGLAGGPMWIFKDGMIEPIDDVYELAPRKGWKASKDADLQYLENAFRFIEVPMMQESLQAIIFLGMKLAEDVVGLPMIMQGQMGQTTPDRVGVVEILNQNASTVLRRIARLFDDLLTEPHIRRYYTFLMQYGEDDEKGDFTIDARGSSALVERAMESQEIMQMGQLVGNPIFGLDPKKWMQEYLKSKHLDPKRFEYEDEDWKKVVQNLSQPAADPRLEIAQMNGQLKERLEQARAAHESEENDKDRQLESALAEFEASMERDLKAMEHAGNKDISADRMREVFATNKTALANNVLKLRTQKQLAGAKGGAPQVATPAIEPVGRAPAGQAFQQ